MARAKKNSEGAHHPSLSRLRELLLAVPSNPPTRRDEIRTEVRRLAEMLTGLRTLAKKRLGALTDAAAARDRILSYLKLFVGETIEGEELQVVGGIQEFARRIRELRVEFGYNVSTGVSREELRTDQYVLESIEPDEEAAEKWRTANRIRKQGGGSRDRVLALLKAYVERPVTGEQIAYVAGAREAARRIRELRREFGWRVVTKQTGRPDLPSGTYILESLAQLAEHDRHIPDDVYDGVLERDSNRCRKCGWSVEVRISAAKRQFLEVHHIVYHHEGGKNAPENLVTLCNVHHDEVHRLKIAGKELLVWLKK
ncbi:MAG: HNH endonuclease [Elusimicrobia bacterium]|nr:HNH endonuclease [Elusimicrobiota bacterium]